MVIHFRNLLTSINQQQVLATNIFEDNQGAVSLSKGSKSPHVRNTSTLSSTSCDRWLQRGLLTKYVETNLQRADILTKSLGAVKFLKNRLLLLGV